MNDFSSLARAAAAALGVFLSALAHAQAFPSKAVHVVVPYAPGGQVDLIARMLSDGLAKSWASPVVVEYKAGFAGNMGIDYVAKAPPDGHVLVIAPAGNLTISPHLHSKLPYNALTDLAPVALLATADNVLVVSSQVSARSVQELIAFARSNPGKVSFASSGVGSLAHVAGELLRTSAGLDLIHVSYKGGAPAIADLLGGRVSMMFLQLSLALPHIKSGALRPLGVAKLKRSPLLPEVPTLDEQGLARFEAVSWYALMAPRDTPSDIVAKVSADVTRILKEPEVVEKLVGLGVDPAGGSPSDLRALMHMESKRWGKVVQDAQIKAID